MARGWRFRFYSPELVEPPHVHVSKGRQEVRAKVELMAFGVQWPDVDEDLSIEGMLRGRKAPGAVPPG